MRRFMTILAAAMLGIGLSACGQTIDHALSAVEDMDCKMARADRGLPICLPKNAAAVAEAEIKPVYCYKTIGGMECYGQPDRHADARAPIQPPTLPVNTLAERDLPPAYGPTVPASLALANPDAREGAMEGMRRELAALQAKADAERAALTTSLAPAVAEPLAEPAKVVQPPPSKPPVKRQVRRTTSKPTPITRRPAAQPAAPVVPARPMTDAEGAALADQQRQRQ